jgi:protein-tyrosine phosphatase
MATSPIHVLFVCMGNICRSPSAEAVFLKLIQEKEMAHLFDVDSAGTHAYHVGNPADSRSLQAAQSRGIDMSTHRARRLEALDYDIYDYILAMDRDNYDLILADCPRLHVEKVRLYLSFAPQLGRDEVPDPYYGGAQGFDHVLDLVEAAAHGFLEHVQKHHNLPVQSN